MPEITCHQALNEDDIPKDRRLLLIAAPGKVRTSRLISLWGTGRRASGPSYR